MLPDKHRDIREPKNRKTASHIVFLQLCDCASGITAELRTVLWKLMEYKVSEDERTVFISPVAVCTIQYQDTFHKRKEVLKLNAKGYTWVRRKHFVSLRHPRLLRFRPDKEVNPADLRITQIPEDKLPKPEGADVIQDKKPPVVERLLPEVPRIVKPPIVVKTKDFPLNKTFDKLYAEGWTVNSAKYMRADTPEQAVILQAQTFPCIEYQPVQLKEGEWVAFHRTPVEEYLKAKQQPEKPMKPEDRCERGGFGDHYNCVSTYREKCPPDLQTLCRRKADQRKQEGEQQEVKTGVPKELSCWSEGCDKPLIVCGYPFYICDNKHAYNHKTGEKWNWKGTDELYHGLLAVLQGRIEPQYQKLFHPQSRKTEHTEARHVSSTLGHIGRTLYDQLDIQEPDPYKWATLKN